MSAAEIGFLIGLAFGGVVGLMMGVLIGPEGLKELIARLLSRGGGRII